MYRLLQEVGGSISNGYPLPALSFTYYVVHSMYYILSMTNIQRYNEELADHKKESGNKESIGTEAQLIEAFSAYEKPKFQKNLLIIAMIAIITTALSLILVNEGFEYWLPPNIYPVLSRFIDFLEFLGALVSAPAALFFALPVFIYACVLDRIQDSAAAMAFYNTYNSILPFLVGLSWSTITTALLFSPHDLLRRKKYAILKRNT